MNGNIENNIYYLVWLKNSNAERSIILDLTKEVYEDFNVSSQILTEYFETSKKYFKVSSGVYYLDYPGVKETTLEFLSTVQKKTHSEIVALIREWMSLKNPEKHATILGVVFTGIKEALLPSKLYFFPVPESTSFLKPEKVLDKVIIENGWVKEIDSGDSCPILGCVPKGEGYFSWRLYPENTLIPILGLFDFCKNTGNLSRLQKWLSKNSDSAVGKTLLAVQQIEEIERFRGALFV